MYFCYIVIISHEKTAWPLIWTNFNPLHPNMLCATFYWNLPIGSGYDFNFFKKNFVNVYSLFRNYIPLENGVTLSLNDLIPLHLRMLCAKLTWNWSNGSGEDFQISSMFFAISWLSPLGKRRCPSFEQLEFPLPKDALSHVWLKLAQKFWRRRWQCR